MSCQCKLMAGGLGLNLNATVDNSPCSCNFWPSRGVGVTLVAATCGIFKLKILTLITQQNKLPGKLKIQENRLAASRDFSKPRWGVYSAPQISLLVGGLSVPPAQEPHYYWPFGPESLGPRWQNSLALYSGDNFLLLKVDAQFLTGIYRPSKSVFIKSI